jgi:membrane associated rhomboid family serine protease
VSQRQPIFNAPAVVIAVLGALLAVHLARQVLPDEAALHLLELMAFIPARLGSGAEDFAGGQVAGATQFLSHVFVHGDFVHLAFNSAWFLAFGTPVARRLGPVRFLAFFLLCGAGGALAFLLVNSAPMVGASGAISGLMGATMRFLFVPPSDDDGEATAADARPPLQSLRASLADRRILMAIAAWVLLNLVFALAAPALLEGRNIAWEAHLGGFFTGFVTFGLFDRYPARLR